MANIIKDMLQRFSGTEPEVIEASSSIESITQSVIGYQILVTSSLAFLSSFYAIFLLTESYVISGLVGFIWASVILNIDRLLILTFNNVISDSKDATLLKKSLLFLFRLLIAVFVALIVSIPLEMFAFKSEIENAILLDREARLDSLQVRYRNEKNELEYKYILGPRSAFERKDSLLKVAIDSTFANMANIENKAQQRFIYQVINDSIVRVPIFEDSPDIKLYNQKLDDQKKERDLAKIEFLAKMAVDSMQYLSELPSLEEDFEREKQLIKKIEFGFISRVDFLLLIQKQNSRYKTIGWIIRGLIILVEVLPTLLKLISKPGEYTEGLQIFRNKKALDFRKKLKKDQLDN